MFPKYICSDIGAKGSPIPIVRQLLSWLVAVVLSIMQFKYSFSEEMLQVWLR